MCTVITWISSRKGQKSETMMKVLAVMNSIPAFAQNEVK